MIALGMICAHQGNKMSTKWTIEGVDPEVRRKITEEAKSKRLRIGQILNMRLGGSAPIDRDRDVDSENKIVSIGTKEIERMVELVVEKKLSALNAKLDNLVTQIQGDVDDTKEAKSDRIKGAFKRIRSQ